MSVSAIFHPQTVRAFAQEVKAYAEQQGWRVLHDGTARVPKPCRSCGVAADPDRAALHLPHLILVRRPRILFVELRSERGEGSARRIAFMAELATCGQEVVKWRPSSWRGIIHVLRDER